MPDWINAGIDLISDGLGMGFDYVSSFAGDIADAIGDTVLNSLNQWVGSILYAITYALCELIRAVYSVFAIFSGISKVKLNGSYTYLSNVFFENSAISGIYWGMVMIGFVLIFAFAIIAVVRKIFDIGDKQRASLGEILGNCFKSFLVMITLTLIMSASIGFTNELVRSINYIFDQNKSLTERQEIQFTDEQYATMARIFNTIGNYSLNPSYSQRFNLNSCYNEIRSDLLYLQDQGVFDLIYPDNVDSDGNAHPSWQSSLQTLVIAASPDHELKMDPYYEDVSAALLNIMRVMRTNADFFPISEYKNQYASSAAVSLDRIVFLTGTMNAAKNYKYNENPSLDDGLRGAFYTGQKSIYSLTEVSDAFDIGITGISYLMIWFIAYFVLKNLIRCILNCAARLVNLVGLYLIAPPIAAVMPLDDGQKFREWVTSMVIQMFGIFGSIVPMRLVIMFVPIILDKKLVLLDNVMLNIFAKILLIIGMLEAVSRFSGILTGILANNAGMAALNASNMDAIADQGFNKYFGRHLPFVKDMNDPNGDRAHARDREKKADKDQIAAQKRGGTSGGGGGSGSGGGGDLPANQGGMASKTPAGKDDRQKRQEQLDNLFGKGKAMASPTASNTGIGKAKTSVPGQNPASKGNNDAGKKSVPPAKNEPVNPLTQGRIKDHPELGGKQQAGGGYDSGTRQKQLDSLFGKGKAEAPISDTYAKMSPAEKKAYGEKIDEQARAAEAERKAAAEARNAAEPQIPENPMERGRIADHPELGGDVGMNTDTEPEQRDEAPRDPSNLMKGRIKDQPELGGDAGYSSGSSSDLPDSAANIPETNADTPNNQNPTAENKADSGTAPDMSKYFDRVFGAGARSGGTGAVQNTGNPEQLPENHAGKAPASPTDPAAQNPAANPSADKRTASQTTGSSGTSSDMSKYFDRVFGSEARRNGSGMTQNTGNAAQLSQNSAGTVSSSTESSAIRNTANAATTGSRKAVSDPGKYFNSVFGSGARRSGTGTAQNTGNSAQLPKNSAGNVPSSSESPAVRNNPESSGQIPQNHTESVRSSSGDSVPQSSTEPVRQAPRSFTTDPSTFSVSRTDDFDLNGNTSGKDAVVPAEKTESERNETVRTDVLQAETTAEKQSVSVPSEPTVPKKMPPPARRQTVIPPSEDHQKKEQ